jgi:hypothetical protein
VCALPPQRVAASEDNAAATAAAVGADVADVQAATAAAGEALQPPGAEALQPPGAAAQAEAADGDAAGHAGAADSAVGAAEAAEDATASAAAAEAEERATAAAEAENSPAAVAARAEVARLNRELAAVRASLAGLPPAEGGAADWAGMDGIAEAASAAKERAEAQLHAMQARVRGRMDAGHACAVCVWQRTQCVYEC